METIVKRTTEVWMESTIMICMLELNSNLKDFIFFPPSELVGFLHLNSLLVYRL